MPPFETDSIPSICDHDGDSVIVILTHQPPSPPGYKQRNLRDRLEGCVDASIDFLACNGIPESSIIELRSAVSENRFLQAVKRIQNYMECFADNTACQNEKDAAFYITFQAWKALRDYTQVLHEKTYREYTQLLANPSIPNRHEQLRAKRQYMSKLGEYTSGSEAGFFRVQNWGHDLEAQ